MHAANTDNGRSQQTAPCRQPSTPSKRVSVIPQPACMTVNDGSFTLAHDTVISYADAEAGRIGAILAEAVAPATGFDLDVRNGEADDGNGIYLAIDGSGPALGAEGYMLTVTPKRAVIRAPEAAGLFYGVQTLLQLLPPEIEALSPVDGVSWRVACVEISDQPRFGWRGLALDVTRHFFTMDEVKAYIDRMVRYKFNSLHLHLSDDEGWRVEIKKHPELTEVGAWRVPRVGRWGKLEPAEPGEKPTYGGFYTQDDVRELVAYAQERFVTLLPEIETPGHAMAMLAACPKLSCTGAPAAVVVGGRFWGEIENTLCPGKESTYTFLDDVFTEVAALFPSEYIHMGGDEVYTGFWEKCPDCRKRMQDEGLADLQALHGYFARRVEKIINAKGKRLIGWDEIVEAGLTTDAAVMAWHDVGRGVAAAKANHHVVMTLIPYSYLDLYQGDPAIEPPSYGMSTLSMTYAHEPIPDGVDPELVLGLQANLWTESVWTMRHAEYMTWPRAFAAAETAWSPQESKNWPEFVRRVEVHFRRFDAADRKYARSMYDAAFTPKRGADKELVIELSAELPDLVIHYAFDGSDPDAHYPKYEAPLTVPKDAALLRVVTCRNGTPVGRVISAPIADLEERAGD